jgi:transposase
MAGSGLGAGHNCRTSGQTIRRFEVITGEARRRRWPEEEKAAIVAESLAPETSISAVARRHGLHPNQLFAWRRQFRTMEPAGLVSGGGNDGFVPIVVSDAHRLTSPDQPGRIDILVGGLTVRVTGPVDGAALHAVLDVARRLA